MHAILCLAENISVLEEHEFVKLDDNTHIESGIDLFHQSPFSWCISFLLLTLYISSLCLHLYSLCSIPPLPFNKPPPLTRAQHFDHMFVVWAEGKHVEDVMRGFWVGQIGESEKTDFTV